jgi:hypothetical protein
VLVKYRRCADTLVSGGYLHHFRTGRHGKRPDFVNQSMSLGFVCVIKEYDATPACTCPPNSPLELSRQEAGAARVSSVRRCEGATMQPVPLK